MTDMSELIARLERDADFLFAKAQEVGAEPEFAQDALRIKARADGMMDVLEPLTVLLRTYEANHD